MTDSPNPPANTPAASEPRPDFWYLIPHGYFPVDLSPSVTRLKTLIEQVLALPEDRRGEAERVLRFYAGIVTSLNAEGVMACLFGMHPDEAGNPVFSVLTFSTVTTPGSAKLAVAGAVQAAQGDADSTVLPLELPIGLAYLSEETRRMAAPGRASRTDGGDDAAQAVWQGTVGIAGPGSEVITVQLVTPAVDLADAYRSILLGVARTFSFTDPNEAAEGSGADTMPEPGAATVAMRSDFG
jgi:hypothetical protein